MKKLFAFLPWPALIVSSLVFCRCVSEKGMYVQFVEVALVRVDTIQRYNETPKLKLTWKSSKDGSLLTSFEQMDTRFPPGIVVYALKRN